MIYPSITNISGHYEDKIIEAKKLNIKEICLFLTTYNLEKRKRLYKLLKKASFKRYPLIHLRHDMELWELDFLANELPSVLFNIHPLTEYSFPNYYLKYKERIYIENAFIHPPHHIEKRGFSKEYAGLCLDFTHFEDDRLVSPKENPCFISLFKQFKIGCGHIGPIMDKPFYNRQARIFSYESHLFTKLSQFNYLKNLPKKYFPEIIALEVENSLEEQLEAIRYLHQIIPFTFEHKNYQK